MANYTIHHASRAHLTHPDRLRLAIAWKDELEHRAGSLTIRAFARKHGLDQATWHRELRRGALGPVFYDHRLRRWVYPDYDPGLAQDKIDRGKEDKGARMLFTNRLAERFRHHILEEMRSPYDARLHIRKEMPGQRIPSLSSVYQHIEAGDIGIQHGQTPYHPGEKRRPAIPPHPAKTAATHRQLDERPVEATLRLEQGHKETDTVVSCAGGTGGLLVVVDRNAPVVRIEKIAHVARKDVIRAVSRMRSSGRLGVVRSVTTDNGCEFSDQAALDRAFGAKTYYTRAYAAWEKGSVENVNRIIRRFFPKGTDFAKVPTWRIRRVEEFINTMHRKSLFGRSAYEAALAAA